jgi:hypothetical protein
MYPSLIAKIVNIPAVSEKTAVFRPGHSIIALLIAELPAESITIPDKVSFPTCAQLKTLENS